MGVLVALAGPLNVNPFSGEFRLFRTDEVSPRQFIGGNSVLIKKPQWPPAVREPSHENPSIMNLVPKTQNADALYRVAFDALKTTLAEQSGPAPRCFQVSTLYLSGCWDCIPRRITGPCRSRRACYGFELSFAPKEIQAIAQGFVRFTESATLTIRKPSGTGLFLPGLRKHPFPITPGAWLAALPRMPARLRGAQLPRQRYDGRNHQHSCLNRRRPLLSLKRRRPSLNLKTAAAPRPAVDVCPWPRDSAIEDFVVLARRFSESEDQLLVGAFLPMVGALLGRNVFVTFGQRVYPNLYNILVSRAGMRNTAIDLVVYVAKTLLPQEALFSGVTSVQAAFLQYLACPDKLWLVGEDVLNNWAHERRERGWP